MEKQRTGAKSGSGSEPALAPARLKSPNGHSGVCISVLLHLQGWAELHLLQRSGDSLLEAGATEQNYRHIREEGQELLRLTQVGHT